MVRVAEGCGIVEIGMIAEGMMKRWVVLFIVLVLLPANGMAYRPVVNMEGIDQAQYEQDLAACREYAKQSSPGGGAVAGAVAGAVVMAGVGAALAILMGPSKDIGNARARAAGKAATFGAVTGGLEGAAAGAVAGPEDQALLIQQCMEGRGYSVSHMQEEGPAEVEKSNKRQEHSRLLAGKWQEENASLACSIEYFDNGHYKQECSSKKPGNTDKSLCEGKWAINNNYTLSLKCLKHGGEGKFTIFNISEAEYTMKDMKSEIWNGKRIQ